MTGTERKRAWRERQKQQKQAAQQAAPSEPSRVRVNPLQVQADILKTLRTEVRLKHSLAADNELAVLLPLAKNKCAGLMQRGWWPTLEQVKALVAGAEYPKFA